MNAPSRDFQLTRAVPWVYRWENACKAAIDEFQTARKVTICHPQFPIFNVTGQSEGFGQQVFGFVSAVPQGYGLGKVTEPRTVASGIKTQSQK
ncbi:MAG: hypothetical protein QOF72_1449 [Blastocatellia bacterium]|jgi:hypothetical protein|nr:hypothetical protein [Blastocatellia bacterium]